jgi:poly-gamma-glutamate capsule biosynthesis protein CapA/YwtB (metallophosphatase superfamily)
MNRRAFLLNIVQALLLMRGDALAMRRPGDDAFITLFLCGDVMTGRGIDQVLPHPSDPILYEPYVRNAIAYVRLAEQTNGPIPTPLEFSYIWGDALAELERVAADVRIINLETSITERGEYWKGKGIHYRMAPENIPCISAAKIDCCALANNHVLDWGYAGLQDTLAALAKAGVKSAGAGRNRKEAEAPAVIEIAGKGRVLVFALGSATSGIPWAWAASASKPGVNLIDERSEDAIRRLGSHVKAIKRPGDIVVASIHWGGNWGYDIPRAQRTFAHCLIEHAQVDVVHGHSSHHPKGIEVYRDKPIIYGCGDFLNDYEGIGGHEEYRADLTLMYFVCMDPSNGRLVRFNMTPMQNRRLRANRASEQDARWLRDTLHREALRTRVVLNDSDPLTLTLYWQ